MKCLRIFILMVWMVPVLLTMGAPAAMSGETVALAPMTVTATKTEISVDLVPFATHSVSSEEIEAQPEFYMNNIGEIIRDKPGVHVGQYYPWGPPWIHLRGTGYFIGRTIYLIDSLPTHPFLITAINPSDVGSVDVVLGPSSALYGPNASGGVVNTLTREGTETTGATTELSIGSRHTIKPRVSIGDRVGNVSYYLSWSGEYSDGYKMKPSENMMRLYTLGKKQYVKTASVEDNDYENTYLAGKLVWRGESGVKASVSTHHASHYLSGGQSHFILNDNGDQSITTVKYEQPIFSVGKVKLSVGHHYDDHPKQDTVGLTVENGVPVLDDTVTYRTDWTRQIIPVDLQTDLYLGENNILTTGLFWSRETEKNKQTFVESGDEKYRSELNTTQSAAYLQDHLFLMDGRLSLLAGMRYDHWSYDDIYDSGSTDPTPSDVSKDYTTYRGGVRYRLSDCAALRASAGTAFWPGLAKWFFQNVTTGANQREANPDLNPEKTVMGDAGLDLNFFESGTLINLTGYYGKIDDIVSYRYDENPDLEGGTIIRSENLGGADIYGMELGFSQELPARFSMTGALTLNRSRITGEGENKGNQLRNAPDYWGSLGLQYRNPYLINAEILFRFSGDRFYDDANTDLPYFHMKAYETVDAKLWREWRLSKKWRLTTAVSAVNITDKEYATEICYMNPGLYVEGKVGVNYRF